MRSTDAGTGEHGDRRFRHHRHVQRHQVAFAETHRLESVGGFAHLSVQLPVGEATHVTGLTFPDQSGFIGRGSVEMPIQTVVRKIGGAAFKPAREGGVAPIKNSVKGLEPVQLPAGGVTPETVGIGLRRLGKALISLETSDARLGSQCRGGFKHPLLLEHAFNRRVGVGHGRLRTTPKPKS